MPIEEQINRAIAAVQNLARAARARNDPVSWAADVLRRSELAPEDKLYLIEVLSAAGEKVAGETLAASDLPRCSFCL